MALTSVVITYMVIGKLIRIWFSIVEDDVELVTEMTTIGIGASSVLTTGSPIYAMSLGSVREERRASWEPLQDHR